MSSYLLNYANVKRLQLVVLNSDKESRWSIPSAQVSQWQGDKARYRTQRKNLFDLRRIAVVHNLHVIARMPETPPGEIAA